MKPLYQIVAAAMLLLFLGTPEADCLVPNARMSAAERMCCQQMAGQCDMNMAAKHPCCQRIVQRHDDAVPSELSHFVPALLSLHVAILELDFSLHVSDQSFVIFERLGRLPHDPPTPSIEILRV
jgi:hypothetical protein